MSNLFQRSVQEKFLIEQNKSLLKKQYELFTAHFHDPEIQNNIKAMKEEQYQEGFLDDLFVKILGYTRNPKPDYNITTEYKNIKDSKKADGAIIINNKVVAVIELKGTDTIDLDKVESQAFGYKNNQTECKYIITSNFEKLRFYIENAVNYEDFNLFNLTEEGFALLYLCLSRFNIENDIPLKIKQNSLVAEDQITKQLYKDYSNFKRDLFNNISKLNSQYDKILIFKKTQKLLDRFLFILFAEDKQLLPTNSTSNILKDWKELKDRFDVKVPLIDRFRQYFHYLNTGEKEDIFAYNGGLFTSDEVLDNVKIDDTLLYFHTDKLSKYDYATEVDVNILGHIFEHSLNELEDLQAELEGKKIDKAVTKRKKDGVYYTPKYITKYIVENTVGKLCEEKISELEIKDEDFYSSKDMKTRKTLLYKLDSYRNWLKGITICDPACGSGAFLNQALEYLIKEHAYIDELTTKLTGGTLIIPLDENSILEHNLYGVDINEESVEIAKLSLWLRTAKKGRKLSSLSNNIKCGNSLIDDPAVAGDKAFNWQKEFPQIFGGTKSDSSEKQIKIVPDYLALIEKNAELAKEKAEKSAQLSTEAVEYSKKVYEYVQKQKELVRDPEAVRYGANKVGFDVVIGNPPYVRQELLGTIQKDYFSKKYPNVYNGIADLYVYFYGLSLIIVKNDGYIGFITPNKWMERQYGQELRNFLINYNIFLIVNYSELNIFEDASTEPAIIVIKNQLSENNISYMSVKSLEQAKDAIYDLISYRKENLNTNIWRFTNSNTNSILAKFKEGDITLDDYTDGGVYYGIKTGLNEAFIIDQKTRDAILRKDYKSGVILKKMVEGDDFGAWHLNHSGRYLVATQFELNVPKDYPVIFEYLKQFQLKLEKRQDQGINFWNLRACDYYDKLEKPKIIYYHTAKKHSFYLDTDGYYISANCYFISNADKYLQCILNSKLFSFVKKYLFPAFGDNESGGRIRLDANKMIKLPIKNIIPESKQPFIEKADVMLALNKELYSETDNFLSTLREEKHIEKIPSKFEKFYELSFESFKIELIKQKIDFTYGAETNRWREYFNSVTDKLKLIKAEIDKTDTEIDRMVYVLYGLTEEEIMIVEEGI